MGAWVVGNLPTCRKIEAVELRIYRRLLGAIAYNGEPHSQAPCGFFICLGTRLVGGDIYDKNWEEVV